MRWDYMYGGGQLLEKEDPPFTLKQTQPSYVGVDDKKNLILRTWCHWYWNSKVCGSIKYEIKDIFRTDRLFAIEFNGKFMIGEGGASIRIGNGEYEAIFRFSANAVTLNGIKLPIKPSQFNTVTMLQAYGPRVELYLGTKKFFNRDVLKPSKYNGIEISLSGEATVILRYLFFSTDYNPCRLVLLSKNNTESPACHVKKFVFAEKGINQYGVETVEVYEITEVGNWQDFDRFQSTSIYKFQVKLYKAASGEVVAAFRRNGNSEPLDIMGGYIELSGGKKWPWVHVIGQEGAAIIDVPWSEAHTYPGFEDVEEKTPHMLSATMDNSTDKDKKGQITFGFDVKCEVQENPPIDGQPGGDYDIAINLRWTVPDERADPQYPFVDLDLWAVSAEKKDGKYVYNRATYLDYTTSTELGARVVEIDDWLRMSLIKDNRTNHRTGQDVRHVWETLLETITIKGNYGKILTVGVGNYAAPSNYASAENVMYLVEHQGRKIELEIIDKNTNTIVKSIVIQPEWLYQAGATGGCVLPVCDILIHPDKRIDIISERTSSPNTIPLPIYSNDFKGNLDIKLQPQ